MQAVASTGVMRMNPHLKDVPFDNAREFIQALQRTGDRWSDGTEYCTWFFRGQRNAEWKLVPSGFREQPMSELLHTYLKEADRWVKKHHIDWRNWLKPLEEHEKRPAHIGDQAWIERLEKAGRFAFAQMLLAREFVMVADYAKHAVRVPDELYLMAWANFHKYFTGELLNNRVIVRTLALAQHHGIPTVLLDWTYNPLAAAFFAAEGALQKPKENVRFAVYGVHRSLVEIDEHIRRVTLPPNTVSFLDAQEGLFLWCPAYYATFLETGTFPDFNTLLEDTINRLNARDRQSPRSNRPASHPSQPFVKFTLPAEQAKEVLRIIWRDKVSPAHLRPSLDNVTAAIQIRSTWLFEAGEAEAKPDVDTAAATQPTRGLNAAITSNEDNQVTEINTRLSAWP
jgi:hypothetical protein